MSKVTPGEYAVKKNSDGTWKVVNTVTGKVHSYHATKKAAKHQKQLLYAVGHGWKPTEKKEDSDIYLLMYPENPDELQPRSGNHGKR